MDVFHEETVPLDVERNTVSEPSSRNVLRRYGLHIGLALGGVPSVLFFLFLMVLQTGIFNLSELATGATLIPLVGDCDYYRGAPCYALNKTNSPYPEQHSCNGPLSCPGRIVSLWLRKQVTVIAVSPSGPTPNNTKLSDIIDLILHLNNKLHLSAFVVLLASLPASWACLAVHRAVEHRVIRIIAVVLFFVTKTLPPIAACLNTYTSLSDIKSNADYPPSFLASLNPGMILLASLTFIFEVGWNALIWYAI